LYAIAKRAPVARFGTLAGFPFLSQGFAPWRVFAAF
jgi:hypothetical protein